MNLMRRFPPKDTLKNLTVLCELIQDDKLKDKVSIKIDQPIGN